MGQIEDAVMRWLEKALPPAMEEAGERELVGLRERLSVPYPYSTGPGGTGPIGGNPALRKGYLKDGVASDVELTPSQVVNTISSSRVQGHPRVPEILETGEGLLGPRPFMGITREGLRDSGYLETVAEGLRSQK